MRPGSFDVFGQRYASTGDTVGTEFQVSTFTAILQGDSAIAPLPSGEFVVAWTSNSQDDDVFGEAGATLRVGGVGGISSFLYLVQDGLPMPSGVSSSIGTAPARPVSASR